ncbi:ribosome assembly factor SBDS [Candidatus Pacearchaeota archaeon]|nr:ribosome assembly factor SBDS [Candidatus Pacearchaeota archaeon]
MTDTIARLKSGKLNFETMVDMDNAMKLKKGFPVNIADVIRDNYVYTDLKKGMRAGSPELMLVFNTTDLPTIVQKIVQKGEIEVTQEFRDEALENRRKQIIDFLSRNGVSAQTGRPYTPDMLESAIKQAGIKIENVSVEKQITKIVEGLKRIIPIKIETKKIKLKIPPQFTGQCYGLIQEYKEREEWLGDGSLEAFLNIPVGLQMEFYDKLNKITHGAALTSEVKE